MAKAFTFFREYRDLCEKLNDEERLRVYECVMDYYLDGENYSEHLGELKPVFDKILAFRKEEKKKKDFTYYKTRETKYKEYLKSGHWKALRKEILASYNKCEICHRKDRLELHHKWYGGKKSILGKETKADLAVLCHRCHKKYHATYPCASKINYSKFYKKNYKFAVRGVIKKDGTVIKVTNVCLPMKGERVDK